MNTIKTTIAFLVVIFLTFNIVSAQTTPLKHRVVKGDNVYRLSLRYGVSMESIFQLNPESRKIIKVGETLFIPQKGPSTAANNNSNTTSGKNSSTVSSSNNSKFETYLVSKGETKYGLSKKFNMSIKALEEANPSIVKMLLAGQTIKIPSKTSEIKTPSNTNIKVTSHRVEKGENLWKISQQYNMTLAELKALNTGKLGKFLQIGQELSIQNDKNKEDNNTYIVAKGDTKFSLSQRFNMSISRLEQLNPDIVPILKYGTRIRTGISEVAEGVDTETGIEVTSVDDIKNEEEQEDIEGTPNIESLDNNEDVEVVEEGLPIKETMTTVEDSIPVSPTSHVKDYTIKPKETLYGLAKKANMSIEEFLELNPSLKESVTKGSIIKMPINTDEPNIEVTSPAENASNNNASTTAYNENTYAISVVWDDSSTTANPELKKQKSGYYLGLQKAVDSMRKLHPKSKLLIQNNLSNQIDPKDSLDLDVPQIVLYPMEHMNQNMSSSAEIDLMSLRYNYQDSTKNLFFKGLPSEEDMQRKVLSHLKNQNAQIICIYDENHVQNKNLIENILPETNFIATNKNGTFESIALKSALKTDIKNFIIVESDKVGIFLSSTNILLKEMSRCEIQLVVLHPKNIPTGGAVAIKRFKILKLLYPQQYNSEISEGLSKSTALGFAFNFDILERLFANSPETFNMNATTSVFGFSFNYVLNDGIYENKSVILFVFDENSSSTQINKK